jgi:hypothetical protein
MSEVCIQISAVGLKNIPIHDDLNDFEFIVGSHSYRCPKYIADFLSPKIGRFHKTDLSLDHYVVEICDDQAHFENFLSIGRGCSLTAAECDLKFFAGLCRELENFEVCSLIHQYFQREVTIENCIEQFELCFLTGESIASVVKFTASHFHELPHDVLRTLSFEHLQEILHDAALQIRSEDSLFELICDLSKKNDSFWSLVEFIRFEFLSVESMMKISAMSSDFLTILNANIWQRILSRLILEVYPLDFDDRVCQHVRNLTYQSESPLQGIISHLSRECNGNVIDHGIVDVRASSVYDCPQYYQLKHAVELDSSSEFLSSNAPDQSITYDFKERRVRLSGYTIRSRTHPTWHAHGNMKSWVVQTSDDGESWIVIDIRLDETCLDGKDLIHHFVIRPQKASRFIQVRQLGDSHKQKYLAFSGLEFFGQLIE